MHDSNWGELINPPFFDGSDRAHLAPRMVGEEERELQETTWEEAGPIGLLRCWGNFFRSSSRAGKEFIWQFFCLKDVSLNVGNVD